MACFVVSGMSRVSTRRLYTPRQESPISPISHFLFLLRCFCAATTTMSLSSALRIAAVGLLVSVTACASPSGGPPPSTPSRAVRVRRVVWAPTSRTTGRAMSRVQRVGGKECSRVCPLMITTKSTRRLPTAIRTRPFAGDGHSGDSIPLLVIVIKSTKMGASHGETFRSSQALTLATVAQGQTTQKRGQLVVQFMRPLREVR